MQILHRVSMGSLNQKLMRFSSICTSTFYENKGLLLLCTQKIFQWKAEPVKNIEIKNDQEKTVAQDYKKVFVENLRRMGILEPQSEVVVDKSGKEIHLFPEQAQSEGQSGNVLASEKSRLAACFYIPE